MTQENHPPSARPTKNRLAKKIAPMTKNRKALPDNAQAIKISPAAQSLISVFILAIGLAAIAAVGYLAYARLTPASQNSTHDVASAAVQSGEQAIAEQPKDKTTPKASNLDKAAIRQFTGKWIARNGSQTVYATLNSDKTFELLVLLDRDGMERRYSKGIFEYDEEQGILTLRSDHDPLPEIEGVRMKTLTRRPYGIIPLIDKKTQALVWVAQNRGDRRNSAHPIFTLLGRSGSYIVWTPQK